MRPPLPLVTRTSLLLLLLCNLEFASSFFATPLDHRMAPRRAVVRLRAEINPGAVSGTSLRILEYPHPALRAPNADVDAFDDELRQLAKEMVSIMYASGGCGLAAPQVGVNRRLMVFNPTGDPSKWMQEYVMCNARIIQYADARSVGEEGCLSFPGFTADVARSNWIKIEYTNVRGKKQRKKLKGFDAIVFQHEYDHLDGVLYIDHLSEGERSRVQADIDALAGRYTETSAGPAAL